MNNFFRCNSFWCWRHLSISQWGQNGIIIIAYFIEVQKRKIVLKIRHKEPKYMIVGETLLMLHSGSDGM